MSDDTLSNKQMDEASERAEAHTQACIQAHFAKNGAAPQAVTKQQMLDRIKLLGDEIEDNNDENRLMQKEIDALYVKIGALG